MKDDIYMFFNSFGESIINHYLQPLFTFVFQIQPSPVQQKEMIYKPYLWMGE